MTFCTTPIIDLLRTVDLRISIYNSFQSLHFSTTQAELETQENTKYMVIINEY